MEIQNPRAESDYETYRHVHSRSQIRRRHRRNSSGSESPKRGSRSGNKKVSEEEIAEYLAKRAQKKAMKVAKKLKSQTVSGYSNDSNPFGDSNLNEKFVWRKKIERDVTQGVVPLEAFSMKAEKKRQRERMAEIEKVKKRRDERASEKQQHEEEMALLARERARAEFQDWEKKEEEFNFDQSKVRSEIRIREGRIKPIDILTKQLDDPSDDDDLEIELIEPYMVFNGLSVKEIEELHDDIKLHLDLDRTTPTRIRYWEALLVVSEWELAEARRRDSLERARVRGEKLPLEMNGEEGGLHASVESDVKNLLEGKTYVELEALQTQIESQMRSGTAKVVEYWEAVLKRLRIYKAKASLYDIYAELLRKHLEYIENKKEPSPEPDNLDSDQDLEEDAEVLSPTSVMDEEVLDEEPDEGSYSPQMLNEDENEDDVVNPEEDEAALERRRIVVKEERRVDQELATRPTIPADTFERNALKVMGSMEEGDAVFGLNNEINLDSQVYWWHDKYRPRKPKYFNRVHTGYEWNKYNQTHYDHDNPPPKTVQGYKFNIFYPDLVDKSRAPTYTIKKDGDSAETCIITFHAGPPYEDIAFRIVNNEWEYSHKKGFKCTFDQNPVFSV